LASAILGRKHLFESCKAGETFAPAGQPLPDHILEWARETITRGMRASAECFFRRT
ncbi:2OG-Fe(II) oxygenase superfamily protein, partial [Colletotrichum tofieldiae]